MMSASAEEEILPAPPQPPSPLPDEPFFAPAIVDGIDGEILQAPQQKNDPLSDMFSTLSERMSQAVRVSRSAVTSVLPVSKPPLPGVLFFGDSLTQRSAAVTGQDAPGWSARLQEVYSGKVDLFIRGFSGYNTCWGNHILPQVMEQCSGRASLKVAVIFFGANDAVIDTARQHVPLKQYVLNLRKMIEYIRRCRRVQPIQTVLVTPPPVQEVCRQGGIVPERLAARTLEYAAACMNVAKDMSCPVVDVHTEMMERLQAEWETEEEVQEGLDKYLNDGLHLNAEGNELVAEMMLDMFRKHVPELSPDIVKRPFPLHKDIDNNNLEECLGTGAFV